MKKRSFWTFLSIWCCAACVLLLLNGFWLKSAAAHSAILASLGVWLLLFPVYPASLETRYEAKTCRKVMRLIGVLEILCAFLVRTTF